MLQLFSTHDCDILPCQNPCHRNIVFFVKLWDKSLRYFALININILSDHTPIHVTRSGQSLTDRTYIFFNAGVVYRINSANLF